MQERQWSSNFEKIDKRHRKRYEFAKERVSGFVLDAACGCGYGSYMLNESADVTGVDIDEKSIAFANFYWPGPEYRVGDARDFQGVFDWIVCLETMEHIAEPEKMLKEFRKSENLIISVPCEDHKKFDPSRWEGAEYPHLRHYTPKQLQDALESADWKVVEKWGQTSWPIERGPGRFLVWICE